MRKYTELRENSVESSFSKNKGLDEKSIEME